MFSHKVGTDCFITTYLIHLLLQVVPQISTDYTDFSVDDQVFVADGEYAARVRSSPNQAHFKGEWSDWSPEVQWKTKPATQSESLPQNEMKWAFFYFVILC